MCCAPYETYRERHSLALLRHNEHYFASSNAFVSHSEGVFTKNEGEPFDMAENSLYPLPFGAPPRLNGYIERPTMKVESSTYIGHDEGVSPVLGESAV